MIRIKPGHKIIIAVCLLAGLSIVLTSFISNKKQEGLPSKKNKPNIIYIMADDLGYGDLGCYGQTKIKTPNIDQLAESGMVFTNHYAGSTVCMPSRASLLTGMDQGHCTVRGNPRWTKNGRPVNLSADDVTVAEELKRAGYTTAIIGKWGLAEGVNTSEECMPSNNGFDYFFGYKTHKAAHHYYWDTLYKNNEQFILKDNVYKKKKGLYTHDLFANDAIEFVKRNKGKPFFLYLAFTIPHFELTVPKDSKKPYLNLGWKERKMGKKGNYYHDAEGNVTYAAMVSRMDKSVGNLIKCLKENGIYENTLIVFTSDNGHQYDKDFFDSNGPLKGKKRDLYEGGIRIPFIASWPQKIKPGTKTEHVSAFWDFLPTACEIVDIKPTNKQINGVSYLPTLLGKNKKQNKHNYLYWEFNENKGPIQAIRKGDWKLVWVHSKMPELYNLKNDISEINNLAASNREKLKEMMKLLETARTEHDEFPLEKRKK